MDIKDFFSGMFSNKPKNVLQTPYGNFNLAKGKDIKRVQKMVIDLQRTTDSTHPEGIKTRRSLKGSSINILPSFLSSILCPKIYHTFYLFTMRFAACYFKLVINDVIVCLLILHTHDVS